MLQFEALKVHCPGPNSEAAVWQAALEAGNVLLHYRHHDLKVKHKSDDSPVTQADMEAQRALIQYLQATGLPVIGEETDNHDLDERLKTFWLTDPLDGTKGYLRGSDEFTVNLALIRNGRPVFGLIYAPAARTMYAGAIGEGVKKYVLNGTHWDEEFLPEGLRHHKGILVLVSHPAGIQQPEIRSVAHRLRDQGLQVVLRSGNSALKFGWLAEGSAHIYIRYKPCSSWDVAAGQALLEAGDGLIAWPQGTDTDEVYGKNLFKSVPRPFTALSRAEFAAFFAD